jgi:hypothetical protein
MEEVKLNIYLLSLFCNVILFYIYQICILITCMKLFANIVNYIFWVNGVFGMECCFM